MSPFVCLVMALAVLGGLATADSPQSYFDTFVRETFGSDGLKATVGAVFTGVTATTDKSQVVKAIVDNFYTLSADTKGFVRLNPCTGTPDYLESNLELGATVYVVNWAWNGASATTYAIVKADSQTPPIESITLTYTATPTQQAQKKRSAPKHKNASPQQAADSSFDPGDVTPPSTADLTGSNPLWNDVLKWHAEVDCNQPNVPACSVMSTCKDKRFPICHCLNETRVECDRKDGQCYAQVAAVGYCGQPLNPNTLTFDTTYFEFPNAHTRVDGVFFNVAMELITPCICAPPK